MKNCNRKKRPPRLIPKKPEPALTVRLSSYAPVAPAKAIEFLVGQLCKQSARVMDQVASAPLGWSAAPGLEMRPGA